MKDRKEIISEYDQIGSIWDEGQDPRSEPQDSRTLCGEVPCRQEQYGRRVHGLP